MKYKSQSAFSLLELTVVIAIIAIVVAISYPSIVEWLRTMESRRVESTFTNMLREARAEVYVSRRDVLVCTLNENGNCDNNGKEQLILFYDGNNNGKKDSVEKIISGQNWKLKHGTIALKSSLNRSYIKYMGDTAKPRGHIGHLSYCSESDNLRLSFKVIFNMQGNVRVERADLLGKAGVGC